MVCSVCCRWQRSCSVRSGHTTCVGSAGCYAVLKVLYGICGGGHVRCVQEVVEGLQHMEEVVEGLRRMVEVVDGTLGMQEAVEGMLSVCCRWWKWPVVCNCEGHTLLVVEVE